LIFGNVAQSIYSGPVSYYRTAAEMNPPPGGSVLVQSLRSGDYTDPIIHSPPSLQIRRAHCRLSTPWQTLPSQAER